MKTRHFALSALFIATLLVGCGAKPTLTPTSPTDTPQHNYNNGLRALKFSDYDDAMASFERAKGLDPKFAPAYEGIGLVHLARNELEQAVWNFEESIKKDDAYAPAYIGLGRVYLAEREYGRARHEFDEAIAIDPQHADAHYYKGTSYMAEEKFGEAREWFGKALDLDNKHTQADRDWTIADKIERAMPGTELGRKIALQHKITRADLSALLIEELKLDQIFRRALRNTKQTMKSSSMNSLEILDIDGNWAEQYIRPLVTLGILMPYPDQSFRPDESVTRRDLAVAMQNTLTAILDEAQLRTMFVGDTTAFPDVPSSNFAYNAVLLTTTRGILQADLETGNFYPLSVVSGADALIGLRQLTGLLP